MNKTVLHPEIFLVKNFLSKEMCDHFIEKGEQVSFEEAKVNIQGRQVMVKVSYLKMKYLLKKFGYRYNSSQ